MSDLLAKDVLTRLLAHPDLRDTLRWTQVQLFIRLSRRIWPEILGSSTMLPTELPASAVGFLSSVLDLDQGMIQLCWSAFGDMVPLLDNDIAHVRDDDLFRVHGHDYQIGAEHIGAPFKTCPREVCVNAKLGEARKVESRLYTLRRGVLPVYSESLYCRKCHTRYYHNYCVQNASLPEATRTYYDTLVPDFIHVTESTFMERSLCIHNETQMVFSHASAEGIARIYNLALGAPESEHLGVEGSSRLGTNLHAHVVLDAFFLHGLMRDLAKGHEQLILPHNGLQNVRFDGALDRRNWRMAGTGQEMWAHACNKCMYILRGPDGYWYCVSTGVTDGVLVGHPCCCVHDCLVQLSSQKDEFCSQHRTHQYICRVHSCSAPVEDGYRTCSMASHRLLEVETKNPSLVMLRHRLANLGLASGIIPTPESSSLSPSTSNQQEQEQESEVNTVKERISRRWTHNEQLFVRCCGVIVSRATFFGSEGVSGVKDFLKATFPPAFPGSLPSYIFYDNNRNLVAHLINTKDSYFDDVGLPADVFHAKSKHKALDRFSQIHCNPARFPELIDKDDNWIFNSSAAEQVNKWFGRFNPIVREMTVPKYNFYLDEMIAMRNRFIVGELHKQGHQPHLKPLELLRGEA